MPYKNQANQKAHKKSETYYPTQHNYKGSIHHHSPQNKPCTEEYLSHSQSGFRPDRSTADVAWAHKWLAAKTKKEDVEIKITGIDKSSAFDTIDRQTLLDILRKIVEEDELRIIRFLLSDTIISTRINGARKEKNIRKQHRVATGR